MTAPLLIEIGVEELPPASMRRLADAFAHGLSTALADAGLAHGDVARYATPRRLAVRLADMPTHTQPTTVEKAGPTVAIAYDENGRPSAAAQGFARSVGTDVAELERRDSAKGERLVYRVHQPGEALQGLLQPAVDRVLRNLPIAKRMRWGTGEAAFVRPVHWLVALHDRRVVELEVFGIRAQATTYGHRFHHPAAIALHCADDYSRRLYDPGFVVADPDERKQSITTQVTRTGRQLGGHALIDDDLVEEVTALAEWPVGIAGRFDAHFLSLPREVLISTLQGHQRYFPVENHAGELIAGFVAIANIQSRDVDQVIAGNERVVYPRLADALFFWQQDRGHGLAAHIPGLKRVSFQKALGSLADKSARIAAIATRLAESIGVDRDLTQRAAALAKTDLLTEMVGEFPDLQGVMGRYYALDGGEDPAVAEALAQQYAPANAGAPIAPDPIGRVLAMSDRLDTLAGIFAIGKRPSGDKDPFALRRAALGVVRTLIEGDIGFDLYTALQHALTQQPVAAPRDTLDVLWSFHMERLRYYYLDQGIAADRFDAVAALDIHQPADFDRRLQALASFVRLPAATTVCAAHKRVRNILRRNPSDEDAAHFAPDKTVEPAERGLADELARQRTRVDAVLTQGSYHQALASLAALAEPLDLFFDQVMVMAADRSLRRNRVGLLHELDRLCTRVADLSLLSLN